MPRPLVTIISPTYNQERFVAGCAESALAQTYPHWEQIFVDDGSTDGTRRVIAGYSDPRISLIALPHSGLGALARSYNAALEASRGSLVAILEGDDQWPSDKLEVQVQSFDAPDTVLSWGRADVIDARGEVVSEVVTVRERAFRTRITTRDAFHRLTRRNFLVPTVTVMIRRQALEAIGGFQQTGSSMLVDLPTWLWTTATQEGEVEFVNYRLGLYRRHEAQTSQRKRAEMTREHFEVVREIESALGAEVLARIGWTDTARRRAESRARLAMGETALESGEYDSARAAFLDALLSHARPGDVALAAAGILSTFARVNLVGAMFTLRAWLQRRRVRPAGLPRG